MTDIITTAEEARQRIDDAGYVYISRCEDAEAAGQGFIVPDPVNPYRLAGGDSDD